MIVLLLIIMLVLAYIIIAILDWVRIFDLKTNAILTLIVLVALMINLTIYLIGNLKIIFYPFLVNFRH